MTSEPIDVQDSFEHVLLNPLLYFGEPQHWSSGLNGVIAGAYWKCRVLEIHDQSLDRMACCANDMYLKSRDDSGKINIDNRSIVEKWEIIVREYNSIYDRNIEFIHDDL